MLEKQGTFNKVNRESLRSQVVNTLREKIISGELLSGTKITERDVSELLDVSRMPARDALMELEKEGLLDNRPTGRYVIELNAEDVKQLFAVRQVLERTAIELAIGHMDADDAKRLKQALGQMRIAVDKRDFAQYVKSDLEVHHLIWEFSRNVYLLDMLRSISGVISVFMTNHAGLESWEDVYKLHDTLIRSVLAKDIEQALDHFDRHLAQSLKLSLHLAASEKLMKGA